MIAADKNMLRATLARGMLSLQLALIELYAANLNSLSISGALVVGFAFTGIAEIVYPSSGFSSKIVEYIYFFSVTLTFVASIFMVSQTTLVTMFSVTKALRGESSEVVLQVVKDIQSQQGLIFRAGIVVVTSIIVHCIMLIWAYTNLPIAIMGTGLYVIGYIFIGVQTKQFYDAFHPPQTEVKEINNDEAIENLPEGRGLPSGDSGRAATSPSGKGGSNSGNTNTGSSAGAGTTESNEARSPTKAQQTINSKARGTLFWCKSVSSGHNYEEAFGVLEKGSLDLYRNEEEYLNHGTPLNAKPFNLAEYRIERDVAKVHFGVSSGVSFGARLTSPFNLSEAVKRFKFVLVPKVSTELTALSLVDLMAVDEESFDLWTRALEKVIKAYEQLYGNQGTSVVQPVNKIANVEHAVEAAINSRNV